MDRLPKPGEFYRHFKQKIYQIVALAEHSETGETLVIYQALYGDFRTYARPLEMFNSEVDRGKYPDAAQQYRFERIELNGRETTSTFCKGKTDSTGPDDPDRTIGPREESVPLNPGVLSFIEAENCEDKLKALRSMKGKVSQDDLGMIYAALDLNRIEGSVDSQLEAVERILCMQRHYDGIHLRQQRYPG